MASADHREYSPTQGNWLRPDPAGLAAVDPMNPQTWNRYAYVANNPVSAIDPTGLMPTEYDGGGGGDWINSIGYVDGGYCSAGAESCGDGPSGGIDVGIGIGIGGGGDGSPAPAASSGGTAHPRPPLSGESNGIPNWLHVQPLNLAQLLGIEPVGGWCDYGPCVFAANHGDLSAQLANIDQQCLDNFNNSVAGKFTNFFSIASPIIGPDRLQSTIEDVGGTALKFSAYTFFRTATRTMVRTPFGTMSGVVADTVETAAKDIVVPVVAATTAAQIIVHVGCHFASNVR